jgi:hypothetical protein
MVLVGKKLWFCSLWDMAHDRTIKGKVIEIGTGQSLVVSFILSIFWPWLWRWVKFIDLVILTYYSFGFNIKTGIILVKCYNGSFICALADTLFSCVHLIYTNKHFWHRCRGMVCWVNFESSLILYYTFIFTFSFSLPFYHGAHNHSSLPIRSTHGHEP